MKTYVTAGQVYTGTMPLSEVCMHMRVAGKQMKFALLHGRRAVQLYTLDGKIFSSPILPGEAGIYEDEKGFYFYSPESKWVVDAAQDANGHWTIRSSDGTENGDISLPPIATVYDFDTALRIVEKHNC